MHPIALTPPPRRQKHVLSRLFSRKRARRKRIRKRKKDGDWLARNTAIPTW